ncbi:MAG: amino acid ABC transporter permease [Clostridium sp.]
MGNFDIDFFIKLIPLMSKYLLVTLKVSVLALIIGIIISLIIAIVVHMKIKILTPIFNVWISFFRGTPLVAQLFFFYFGMVQLFPRLTSMSAFTAAVITIGFNSSAYMAETLRGALLSVDRGQMEAALSLGMKKIQSMRYIILPQAIRVAVPALSNSFCDIIKGSSLAFTIGVTEIMATAQMEGASSYRFLESYTAVILMYWAIVSLLTYVQRKLEIRLSLKY